MVIATTERRISSFRTGGNGQDGTTLVEVMVSLVIVSILTAIMIPSITGFLDNMKEKKYVIEASSLQGSIQAYLVTEYAEGDLESMTILRDLTMYDLDSTNNPLHPFLRTEYTKGATIVGITIDTEAVKVIEILYQVDGYTITIADRIEVRREKE